MSQCPAKPWHLRSVVRVVLLFAVTACAQAEPERIALLLGNSEYPHLNTLPGCQPSTTRVSESLERLGYQLFDRRDATSGSFAATLDQAIRAMQAASQPSVFVYFCGYGAALDDRLFLLPVSARIRRSSDLLAQGFLAKTMLDALIRGQAGRSLVVFDVMPKGELPSVAFDALIEEAAPHSFGLLVVTGPLSAVRVSPLAAALDQALDTSGVASGDLLKTVASTLEGASAARVAALRAPDAQAGAPPTLVAPDAPTPLDPPVPPDATAAAPREPSAPLDRTVAAPPEAAAPPDRTVAAPPEAAAPPDRTVAAPDVRSGSASPREPQPTFAPARTAPQRTLPDQDEMTDDQRRLVQEALFSIGYYSGAIDGIFGPETRAAIRRYQHEIGARMTGRITGEQATRLTNAR